ncbi:MAG TPA: glycosyltransferase family 1 protein [Verrucomicrobiae bacterium]|nr:glycosyltransferase family 1 protein [Verrucomicrobiae bacterium]
MRHAETEGSGVSHASLELAGALEAEAARYGIEIVRLTRPRRSWPFRYAVRRARVDALLVPSGAVPPFMPVPCIPWVHDVAIFSHPEWFEQTWFRRQLTTRLFLRGVRRAPLVFAVSEDTKRALMHVAHIPDGRVTVTYQGIRPIEKGETKAYALVLGTINPRKNIPFLEALWPEVERRCPGVQLLIAGKPRLTFSDARRDDLVAHAAMLLLPSLHEGFGRTALEAMSAGVPVIASNRGAIPEVVGEAGLLLEPDDREGWIQAIVDGFEGHLDGSAGRARSKRFSWQKTADIMLAKLAKV